MLILLPINWCSGSSYSSDLTHSLQLDEEGKYTLFWDFNTTHIAFEVQVQTLGWIGFGISPNGKMYPADVVIGWVREGVVQFNVNLMIISDAAVFV